MVKFRGIEICVVSQFDILRLPEYAHRTSPLGAFDATSASCYIPILPGSQIWFEYTVDGPHPPGAAYFFKLFINDEFITSWDCTSRYGYHGKVTYCLQQQEGIPQRNAIHPRIQSQKQNVEPRSIDHGTGAGEEGSMVQMMLERKAFLFSNRGQHSPGFHPALDHDFVEISVYRIEHRKRIRTNFVVPKENFSDLEVGKLRLMDNGIYEPSRPQRRYMYRLLDPLDAPYAKFRFYYRKYEWLERHGLLNPILAADESSNSSTLWYDLGASDVPDSNLSTHGSPAFCHRQRASAEKSPTNASKHTSSRLSPPKRGIFNAPTSPSRRSLESLIEPQKKILGSSPLRKEDNPPPGSLSVTTRCSVEELRSPVPRFRHQSSRTHRRTTSAGGIDLQSGQTTEPLPQSPSSPSKLRPHRQASASQESSFFTFSSRNKSGSTGTRARGKLRRPLSPFTSGGFLRKLASPTSEWTFPLGTSDMDDMTSSEEETENVMYGNGSAEAKRSQETARRSDDSASRDKTAMSTASSAKQGAFSRFLSHCRS